MTKLNYRKNFGGTCEFCFDNLVRPIAKTTVLIDSPEEIRPAIPLAVLEDGLINNVDTLMECVDCRDHPIGAGHLRWYLDYPESLVFKPLR